MSSPFFVTLEKISPLFANTSQKHPGVGGAIVSLFKISRDNRLLWVHSVSALVSGHRSLIAGNLSHRPIRCVTTCQMTTAIKKTSTARRSPSPLSSLRRSLIASVGGRGAYIIRQSCHSRNRQSPVRAPFCRPARSSSSRELRSVRGFQLTARLSLFARSGNLTPMPATTQALNP